MRVPLRFVFFLLLAIGAFWLFHKAQIANRDPEGDPSRLVPLFLGVVLLGGAAGIYFVVLIMPIFGDWLGNLFFQPNERIESDPHAPARSALARGDYAKALTEFQAVLARDPRDLLALSEMAKIYCEHLLQPEAARELLEKALEDPWPAEDAAFLSSRLAEICWVYLRDGRHACALLQQISQSLPGTRHAANAEHRSQEIAGEMAAEE